MELYIEVRLHNILVNFFVLVKNVKLLEDLFIPLFVIDHLLDGFLFSDLLVELLSQRVDSVLVTSLKSKEEWLTDPSLEAICWISLLV